MLFLIMCLFPFNKMQLFIIFLITSELMLLWWLPLVYQYVLISSFNDSILLYICDLIYFLYLFRHLFALSKDNIQIIFIFGFYFWIKQSNESKTLCFKSLSYSKISPFNVIYLFYFIEFLNISRYSDNSCYFENLSFMITFKLNAPQMWYFL